MKKQEEESLDVFADVDFGDLADSSTDSFVTEIQNENSDKDLPGDSLDTLLGGILKEKDNDVETHPLEDITSTEKKGETTLTTTVEDEDASSSALNAVKIAKAFYEEGGLSTFDEEEFLKIAKEESPGKALMTMLQKEIDHNIEEYKKTLSPEDRARAEANELGIDAQELQTIESDIKILQGLSDEQLEDPKVRATLLQYYYQSTTKFSPERISKEIKRLEDLEEAEEEVKTILPELIKVRENDLQGIKDKAKEAKEQAIQKEQARIDKYKEVIYKTNEIVPGNKINKTTQAKIEDLILKPVKEVDGRKVSALWAKREEDPQKFDTILAYLMLEGVFDGKWGNINPKSKTQAFQELENSLRTQRGDNSTSIQSLHMPKMQDSLKQMEGFRNK